MNDTRGQRKTTKTISKNSPKCSELKITAALCTYNRYDLLEHAIGSLNKQLMSQQNFEVIVIDNSPKPDVSASEAKKYASQKNLIWNHTPIPGLSNARNVALNLSRAPLIAYMDDDAIADNNWLNSLSQTFSSLGKDCYAVGGRVLPKWDGARPTWLRDELLGYLSIVDLGDEVKILAPSQWVAGVNLAFRTEEIHSLGGFEVTLGRVGAGSNLMSNEEIALFERIRGGGHHIAYDPNAIVHHHIDSTRLQQSWFRRRAAWQAVSDAVQSTDEKPHQQLKQSWEAVKEFFLHQPFSDRTVRALVLDQDDPGKFHWQMSAIYDFTRCILAGVDDTDDD